MEQHIATNITDALVPGLNFSGGAPSAEYVKQARQVRWRAQAGDRFSDAAKTIRFNLSDDCWLQSQTLRLQFSITNKHDTAILTPTAHPMAMFENVRLYIGGQVAENMDHVTVLGNLLDLFKPVTRRVAESMENHPLTGNVDERLAIQAGQTRRVIMDLPLGFFKQRIWAPLHLISNCVIELTLGDKLNAFKAGESDNYDLSDVSLLGTCLHVDSAISAGYHQHLDAGMPLPIAYQTVVGTKHIVTNGSFSLNLARALTRVKAIYFVVVSAASANQGTDFVGRANGDFVDGRSDIMNFQLQVGSQRFPDQPATGVAEHYYRLMQALGKDMDHDSISLDPQRFLANKTVYAINLERVGNEAAFSGISTMEGKTLTLTVNNAFTGTAVHNVYVFQVADFLANIRKGAVDINE